MFALKCICDADLCNGDIHLFKKYITTLPTECYFEEDVGVVERLQQEQATYQMLYESLLCNCTYHNYRAYYNKYYMDCEHRRQQWKNHSLGGNQTGSDENDTGITSYSGQLGKLHVSLKTKPTKGPEAQLNRKERKHYLAHKKQTDLTRDILLIGVIVILSIILVGLVVFGIALLLKGRDRSKKKPSKKKKKERKKKAFRR
ncbi:hypothetical protein ANCCAN_02967 [Ancylostoma caninum]|uniref:Uncharacterized protein n=1 Tax=Ancylostoma caninum TaxID=29170 RepID=A0A368H2X2_ANCCA|nr:hypothetical protein ANCCAN_02967 [Ancylostoma caninum]